MAISTEQMVGAFGFGAISMCMEVAECLRPDGEGKWKMTRIYTFADGSTQELSEPGSEFYVCLPAVPGWTEIVVGMEKDSNPELGDIESRPIAAWKYEAGCGRSHIWPLTPGEQHYVGFPNFAIAVVSPDGRVLGLGWPCQDDERSVYPEREFSSQGEWLVWVRDEWAKQRARQAELERQREARKQPCSHCGRSDAPRLLDTDIPF